MKNLSHNEKGFTVVEMLISIIVTALFLISFYQIIVVISQISTDAKQKALADNIAYSYLRRYTSPDSPAATWFVCDTRAGSFAAQNQNDRTINSAAPGTTIISGSLSPAETNLPSPISYKVTALAFYGCSGVNGTQPIRVQSEITYGPRNITIEHAAYAKR